MSAPYLKYVKTPKKKERSRSTHKSSRSESKKERRHALESMDEESLGDVEIVLSKKQDNVDGCMYSYINSKIHSELNERDKIRKQKLKEAMKNMDLSIDNVEAMVEILKNDSNNYRVAVSLAKFLGELNVTYFKNVLHIHGRPKVIHWIRRTVEINDEGGMFTKSGGRKRTIGGIFIQLVKENNEDCV